MTFPEHNSVTLLQLGGDVTFPEHNSVTLLHLGGVVTFPEHNSVTIIRGRCCDLYRTQQLDAAAPGR